jgi:eukaryotic-like serine/threonine-protein kinase
MQPGAEETTDTGELVALSDDLPLPRVGELVAGRYRVGRRLGEGGMGVVHEAVHEQLGRRCAIKFLRRELAGRSRSLERFQREAKLLGGMSHPHITQVLDFGHYRERSPYIVMEFLDGHTLRDVLKREGPRAPALALTMLRQVTRAMAYAHDRGVVHRDLKPDNLMLVETGEDVCVKILDFGIAQHEEPPDTRLTPSGAVLGTSHYMSPEQARGEKQLGAPADVYSLGVIFYELLSCRRPHPGDSYAAVLFHLLTEPAVPLAEVMPNCPPELWAVIERCLRSRPQDRYPSAGALLETLEALALRASAGETPLSDARPISSRLVPRGFWVGVASGTALGALLAIGASFSERPAAVLLGAPSTTALALGAQVSPPPEPPAGDNSREVAPTRVSSREEGPPALRAVGTPRAAASLPARPRAVAAPVAASASPKPVRSVSALSPPLGPEPAPSALPFVLRNPYD